MILTMKIVAFISSLVLAGNLTAAAGDNSIIYLRPTDSLTMNPWLATDFYSNEIIANIFEGLVRFKKNTTTIEPCLASAWEVRENGKRWIFTLRRGVKFHNGADFDAQAVLYSFNKRLDKTQTRYKKMTSFFSTISHIRATNNYKVEIILNHPYAPFIQAMADPVACIVYPAAEKAEYFSAIGTGPFRFSGWTKVKSLILTRNPNYWDGRINLEKIIFKVMPHSLGRILQIKNNSADMTFIQSAKEYEEFSRRKEIAILSNPSFSTHFLAFNSNKKPFDRLEIRAAFLHLINKEILIKRIFQNLAIPAFSPLPLPLYSTEQIVPVNDFDLELARKLLKKAGYEKGFTCSLYFASGQGGIQEIADHLAIFANKIGITVKKIKLPFAELMKVADRGEHELLIVGWSAGPDPDLFLNPLLTFTKNEKNFFHYENPGFFVLLQEGQTTLDAGARNKIYRDAMTIWAKDIPGISLFHMNNIITYNKNISGLYFNPFGHVMFRDVTREFK